MKKMIFSFVLLGIGLTQLTFKLSNQCSCSQLSLQNECAYQSPICTWDSKSSSCSTQSCSKITDQTSCAANKNCMFKDGACVDYTLCNQLNGVTQGECLSKSLNCPGSDGKVCTGSESLKSCSSLNSTSCPGYISSNGLCVWDSSKTTCSVLSTCSQLNSTACVSYAGTCLWNTTANSCSQASCSQYATDTTCTNYLLKFDSYEFQLCGWNTTNSSCSTANDASQLNSSNCVNNTKSTYSWSSSQNKCVVCLSYMIQIAIIFILGIMI